MKKIVAFAAFFMLMIKFSTAQSTDLRLGFQVSPAFSFMTTDEQTINGNGANLGLKLGLMGEVFFRENYAFTIGLGFSFNSGGTLLDDNVSDPWQGTDWQARIPGVSFPAGTDFKYGIQYVEIPFGLKFRTNEIGYLRYYAEMPTFVLGFRSKANGDIQYSGVNEDGFKINDDVAALALSWGAGGGIEYSVGEGTSIVAGLAYQQIFTDVTKDYTDNNSAGKIHHIIVRLGVLF